MSKFRFYLQWVAFCLVFLAIPLWMIAFWQIKFWCQKQEGEQQRHREWCEVRLNTMTKWGGNPRYLSQMAKEMQRRAEASPVPLSELRRCLLLMKARFPGAIESVVLDPDGAVVADLSDGNISTRVLSRFYRDFRAFRLGSSSEGLRRSMKIYQAFFGPLLTLELLKNPDFEKVSHAAERSEVFFSKPSDFGMFILFLKSDPRCENFWIKDAIRRHNRQYPERPAALVHLAKETQVFLGGGTFGQIPLEKIMARVLHSQHGREYMESGWWFHRLIQSRDHLLVHLPDLVSKKKMPEQTWMIGAMILLFGLLSFTSLKVMDGTWTINFSIRTKLMCLFIYSVGLPLVILGIQAMDYHADLRFRLERQNHEDSENALRVFDKKYPIVLSSTENLILQAFAPMKNLSGVPWREGAKGAMDRLIGPLNSGSAFLVDKNGVWYQALINNAYKEEESLKRMQTVESGYVRLLKRLNGVTDTGTEDQKLAKSSALLGAAGFDVDSMFADFGRSLNRIQTVRFGKKDGLQGIFPLTLGGEVGLLAVFTWPGTSMERKYLETFFPQQEREHPEIKLGAIEWNPSRLSASGPLRVIPREFPFRELVRNFASDLAPGGAIHKRLRQGSRNLLLTGIRGEELQSFVLWSVRSDEFIEISLAETRKRFFLISLALIAMALTVGFMGAKQFLEPVQHLTIGVHELKVQHYRARVPVLNEDELGELSHAFNQLMENLQEVSVGKQVQERLFPQKVLTVGEYRIFGTSRTATQLGGDYFDYLLTPEGKILVLIGDVTGHGVPAALVMAMSKAVITTLSETINDPYALLERLNRVVESTMKKKLFMTLSLLWIDPVANQLQLLNCGHPFPIRRSAEGNWDFMAAEGFPIGMKSPLKTIPKTFPMNRGDRWFLYTDGLAESLDDASPDISGFEIFRDYLASRPLLPVEVSCVDLLDNHLVFREQRVQEDDFTVVIVERVTGSEHDCATV